MRTLLKSFAIILLTYITSTGPAFATVELGAVLGTPAGGNVVLGNWSRLLLRASGGYWGKSLHGGQGEIGYTFDNNGKLWQYVAIAADTYCTKTIQWDGIGPVYTLNASGFLLQLGANIGKGWKNDTELKGVKLLVQVGYTFIWGQK